MAPIQPASQLLRVTSHQRTQVFKAQTIDPFVPSQPINQIIRTGDGIVADKFNDAGCETKVDSPPVLPVPDAGSCYTDLSGDIFLIQAKLNTTAAQVIAEGDGFCGEFFRWLNYFLSARPSLRPTKL